MGQSEGEGNGPGKETSPWAKHRAQEVVMGRCFPLTGPGAHLSYSIFPGDEPGGRGTKTTTSVVLVDRKGKHQEENTPKVSQPQQSQATTGYIQQKKATHSQASSVLSNGHVSNMDPKKHAARLPRSWSTERTAEVKEQEKRLVSSRSQSVDRHSHNSTARRHSATEVRQVNEHGSPPGGKDEKDATAKHHPPILKRPSVEQSPQEDECSQKTNCVAEKDHSKSHQSILRNPSSEAKPEETKESNQEVSEKAEKDNHSLLKKLSAKQAWDFTQRKKAAMREEFFRVPYEECNREAARSLGGRLNKSEPRLHTVGKERKKRNSLSYKRRVHFNLDNEDDLKDRCSPCPAVSYSDKPKKVVVSIYSIDHSSNRYKHPFIPGEEKEEKQLPESSVDDDDDDLDGKVASGRTKSARPTDLDSLQRHSILKPTKPLIRSYSIDYQGREEEFESLCQYQKSFKPSHLSSMESSTTFTDNNANKTTIFSAQPRSAFSKTSAGTPAGAARDNGTQNSPSTPERKQRDAFRREEVKDVGLQVDVTPASSPQSVPLPEAKSSQEKSHSTATQTSPLRSPESPSKPKSGGPKHSSLTSSKSDNFTFKTDQCTSQTDESTYKANNGALKTHYSSKTDSLTSKSDNATFKTDNFTSQTDNVTSAADNATFKTDNFTSQTENLTSGTDNATFETDNFTSQTDNFTSKTSLHRPRLSTQTSQPETPRTRSTSMPPQLADPGSLQILALLKSFTQPRAPSDTSASSDSQYFSMSDASLSSDASIPLPNPSPPLRKSFTAKTASPQPSRVTSQNPTITPPVPLPRKHISVSQQTVSPVQSPSHSTSSQPPQSPVHRISQSHPAQNSQSPVHKQHQSSSNSPVHRISQAPIQSPAQQSFKSPLHQSTQTQGKEESPVHQVPQSSPVHHPSPSPASSPVLRSAPPTPTRRPSPQSSTTQVSPPQHILHSTPNKNTAQTLPSPHNVQPLTIPQSPVHHTSPQPPTSHTTTRQQFPRHYPAPHSPNHTIRASTDTTSTHKLANREACQVQNDKVTHKSSNKENERSKRREKTVDLCDKGNSINILMTKGESYAKQHIVLNSHMNSSKPTVTVRKIFVPLAAPARCSPSPTPSCASSSCSFGSCGSSSGCYSGSPSPTPTPSPIRLRASGVPTDL